MARRRRRTARGGGGFPPVLLLLLGGPLLLIGALSGPKKPDPVPPPVSYVSLPADPQVATREPIPAPQAFGPSGAAAAPTVEEARPKADVVRAPSETLYVSGRKVPLRAAPNPQGKILDRYGPGQAVDVLERGDGWIRVRHRLTQREGWLQAKRLRAEPPVEAAQEKPERPEIPPMLGVAAIAKVLIADSIASYPGPCACPYQSARNGSSCGRRAAYARPGGYAPLCYAKDVTPAMIAEYRARQ